MRTLEKIARPRGIFPKEPNFMTPALLYFAVKRNPDGAARLFVELSQGFGFAGEKIYGVSVRLPNGERPTPDPSRCCFTRAEADALIAEL